MMYDDIAPAEDWELKALCRSKDPAWWDTDITDGLTGKQLCGDCDVSTQCLTAVLRLEVTENGYPKRAIDRTGIWGGLDPEQRATLAGRGAA